ncbi:MAG: DNA repair and recombination protein RadB [Candidatus Bathyarchaeota archaeon BA1]|nr:MAG: DNA repair and recombination protein RadB [Candidatus Bathyarchaeota archaeon BA1]
MVPTGCGSLDRLLEGGLPIDGVCLVYGEAETGKTSLAIQCAINSARMDYKVIFIDSDGTFSTRRLSQIAYHDFDKIAPLIILVRPINFQEQAMAIDDLGEYITKKVGLVIVDTITSLYRAELGGPKETFELNRELSRQVAYLAQAAKTHKVATLITSQVRSAFEEEHVSVEPVATRVLRFWSDVVINLRPTGQRRVMRALVEKHPKHKHLLSCYLTIERTGIHDHRR